MQLKPETKLQKRDNRNHPNNVRDLDVFDAEPKPEQKPKAPEPAPGKKKSETWLWVFWGGIAAAVIIDLMADWLWPIPAVIIVAAVIVGMVPRTPTVGKSVLVPTGSLSGHDFVDMGLSVKWAAYNVGATMPEDYGSYFAWGETTPKSEYTRENYKFGSGSPFTKYDADGKLLIDLSDDAARANWGGTWRMPTEEEMTELREKCNWEWKRMGRKKGYLVTSKRNGNRLFLPAAGYRREGHLRGAGSYGYFWSSSLETGTPNRAWDVSFDLAGVGRCRDYRGHGFSIRPVTE